MSAELRRYLRQQIELGGEEVYGVNDVPRSSFLVPRPSVPAEAVPVPDVTSTEEPMPSKRLEFPIATAETGVSEAKQSGRENEERGTRNEERSLPKWRKDAPPVPGPGLTIQPPALALLGPVAELPTLDAVAKLISGCTKCALCQTRTNTVPGEGNPEARLMCIGEGPGATEDEKGRPFVGAAGQLLDQILSAIECPRESVYIANIVKCRPPQNRKPLPDEATSCLPYLHRQIALVKPTVILALGGTAAEWLLNSKQSLGSLRGKVHRYGEIPVIVTYHPAALLRNPNWKKPTWEDVRIARQLLD